MDSWGAYSEEIQDYTKLGLQQKLSSPEGMHLAEIIDPYSYRENIKVPTLIVKGANDPYWTVDALSEYWGDLKQPKWVVTVPNAGHGLGNKIEAVESVGAFARALAGDFPMPKQTWSIAPITGLEQNLKVSLGTDGPPLVKLTVWAAEADSLDFRSSTYKAIANLDLSDNKEGKANASILVKLSTIKNTAVFAEARYQVGTRQFSLCCPTEVFRRSATGVGR